ncbi:putative ABC1 protein At2g40090 isoform X2 [Typha latifolia]|uniref:putative ABC1 protein At2g40090 isoform X2 n=1 Tax=Typha latifolia TaxID=4733 RepID=UPI003C2CFD5D
MWRSFAKLAAGAALLGVGGGAAAVATFDDPSTAVKICTIVPLRLLRDSVTAATIAFDYQFSLHGLKEGSIEWLKARHEVHNRCAHRLQELCFRNGGIYIKLGQHIGQLEYVVPEEYLQTMRASMLKRCPVSSYDQVRRVFVKELGGPPESIFAEFDPVPLASASLAQVHYARTHDGQKVAVKVQHTHLTDTAVADIATVEFIVNFLHWCFPAFDYRWLVDEIRESAPKVSEAFAEMTFKHGFVHCDPHAANMMVRPLPSNKWNILGRKRPQLILLDHGLYKELDFATRTSYAALWKGLVFADVNAIKDNSVKLGAGEDLYALFAGVLTMRPWKRVIDPSVDHLVLEGNEGDRSELQMYASQYLPQISELLRRLPRVILLMLKTNDCLRAVNHALVGGYSLESFLIIGRVSSEAVLEAKKMLKKRSLLWGLRIWFEQVFLAARLLSMKVALWLLQVKRSLPG